MTYQALYRVWRPRTFADLVGQTHITRTLQNALEQEKFSHAYLFSGPRGTGKTSAAKIFAQTINCEQAPTREPCNTCAACVGILDGSISDVIEIDAASNTSVDDVREIRDKVKYASSAVPYKVYIIDEVHMISTSAFNALLKTLEEPPAHVVFILATTEPHKIPLTIISRCQRFDFRPIGSQTIMERMQTIVDEEKVSVSGDALESVALSAEGGMRDALSILDQAISYSEETVELDDVLAVTGSVAQPILTEMTRLMHTKDAKETLMLLDQLIQEGKDPGRFVFDLIYFLRDMLLYKSAPSLEGMLERVLVDDAFKEVAASIEVPWIQQAIVQLNTCQQEIKWTNSPKVFVEITLLTIANDLYVGAAVKQPEAAQAHVDGAEQSALMKRVEELERVIHKLETSPQPSTQKSAPEPRRQQPRNQRNRFQIPMEQVHQVLREASKPSLQEVQGKWSIFLSNLKDTNAPAHATIQDSKPVAASEAAIVVAFRYEIHCSLFLDNKDMIQSVVAQVMGKPLTIIPIPSNAWQDVRSDFIENQGQQEEEPEEKEADPLIEAARDLVGEDLLEVHDSFK